jgi:hypothetical protein
MGEAVFPWDRYVLNDGNLPFVPATAMCACGHDGRLHDAFGCLAFLGGFPETRDQKRYCSCTSRRSRRAKERANQSIPLGELRKWTDRPRRGQK